MVIAPRSLLAADRTCPLSRGVEVSEAVQACLESAQPGDHLFFVPGLYLLSKTVEVKKPLVMRTAGRAEPCGFAENHGCAEFKATSNFFPNPGEGLFSVKAENVTMQNVVINGAKFERRTSPAGKECAQGNNAHGYNFSVFANRFTAEGLTTKNALCATGFFGAKGVSQLTLKRSFVGNNGIHNMQGLWADGATFHDLVDSVISNNVFYNNTDIDLIFGGCQNCRIENNLIKHEASFEGSAFAALMLQAWPQATSGNFTGSLTRNNTIECGPKRCGFGLYLGAEAWYSAPLFGGIVENNHIDGAMLGLNVDKATGSVVVRNNTVTNSGGKYLTSCGRRRMKSYNISPGSVVDRAMDQIPTNAYQRESWKGCIPNWWTQDSAR
jgi:hypothetical protein